MIHLTQLNIVSSSHVRWSTSMLNSLHMNNYSTSFAIHITSQVHCSTSYSHMKQLPQRITCTNKRHWTIYCQVISSLFTWILIVTSTEYLPLQNPYIKSHLHLPLQNIYTYWSPIYIYPCKTSTYTDLKSHFPMSMRNWMLPRFPNNYRTERDSDERAYYAGL